MEAHIEQSAPRPERSTVLAYDRTRLAYQRTMLSWVRTGTSLITFGFAIYNFHRIATGDQPSNRLAEIAVTYLNDKARKYVEPLARELEALTQLIPLGVGKLGDLIGICGR